MSFEKLDIVNNEKENNLPKEKGSLGKNAPYVAAILGATIAAGYEASAQNNNANEQKNVIIQKEPSAEIAKKFLGGEYESYLKQYHDSFEGKTPTLTKTDEIKAKMKFKGVSPWTKRTYARAVELAIKSGAKFSPNSKVEFEQQGNVPTQIKVDGRIIPLSMTNYTSAELKGFGAAVSATEVNQSGTNATSKTEKPTAKPSTGAGKGYQSPDLENFLK